MLDAFAAMLDWRFFPFNFSIVPGFPNAVPTIEVWGGYLPIFKGDDGDHPTQHLINFHECMDQFDIFHEDVHVFSRRRHMTMIQTFVPYIY